MARKRMGEGPKTLLEKKREMAEEEGNLENDRRPWKHSEVDRLLEMYLVENAGLKTIAAELKRGDGKAVQDKLNKLIKGRAETGFHRCDVEYYPRSGRSDRGQKIWTDREDNFLKLSHSKDPDIKRIAGILNRSEDAIVARIRELQRKPLPKLGLFDGEPVAEELFAPVPAVSLSGTSGNKYHRVIRGLKQHGGGEVVGDVYSVLTAFNVTVAGLQHAAKKILCAGLRGKGDALQDLKEARDALDRAIEDLE